jgi:hypothetical protein
MVKLTFRRWRKPPPMLVFTLAVMLPAAALIFVSAGYLRHIQRGKMLDAAIQLDYQHMLKIAEKRIVERAYETAEAASLEFPDAGDSDGLDTFLKTHPEITHAFLWRGKGDLELRSQPVRMIDSDFQAENKKLADDLGRGFELWSEEHIANLKRNEAADGRHVDITSEWITRGDKLQYESFVYFLPRGSTPDHPALAGFVYDEDYLKNSFFPQALNEVLPDQNPNDTSHQPQSGIMIRKDKDQVPFAASLCWDGGTPEVERGFGSVFQGLILGIRPHGTTIADISNHWTHLAFLNLGALSLLMGGGMLFAYRSLARELALAKLKSDFVSNVSHELRTPCHSFAFTQRLWSWDASPPRASISNTTRSSAKRASV